MADPTSSTAGAPAAKPKLEQGTYEILRARLSTHGNDLRARLAKLNTDRQEVFGAIATELIATERLTTENNCTPRDMRHIGGGKFIFGYNVQLGLRAETRLADVFALYEYRDRTFHPLPLDGLGDAQFETDFKSLYRYYKGTSLAKLSHRGPHLFMEFRVGKSVSDFKTFKWLCDRGALTYLGNRFDHEYTYPPQHEFEWKRAHRDHHRAGAFPHISIEDRVFVECVGGDLTVKVEDNTASGEGIYTEPVEQRDQTLDDAEIFYAIVGNLILLRIRPYQEKKVRHFVFNEKLREVRRIDAIEDACVLLPDGQGLIFPRGYYLQSGEYKLFELDLTGWMFLRRDISPNGEDTQFVFYERVTGTYVLLSYNVIARTCETPLVCHGFALFDSGELAVFRADEQPQRHHVVQVWQTPYTGPDWQPTAKSDNYLFKLGNAAIVRAMAECGEVLTLLGKDDTYAGLYLDLVERTTAILESYFWLARAEAGDLRAPLQAIKEAAAAALAEFDKVAAIKRNTASETQRVVGKATGILRALPTQAFDEIGAFVARLAELRATRGELISLKELRYVDESLVDRTEEEVSTAAGALAERTVQFLLSPKALDPLRARVDALKAAVPVMPKVTEAEKLEQEISGVAKDLDLLVETVSNLKIQDATETTRVIEDVAAIYAVLN
ncbi:MAG TPA: DNA repair ATPase, partial [Chthoniobacteraceae bacterium]|nr:DNA repair ATPase [Chthoniobacteraceae bacterium]